MVGDPAGGRDRHPLRGRPSRWPKTASTTRPKRASRRSPRTAPPAIARWRGCGEAAELARRDPAAAMRPTEQIAGDSSIEPVLRDLAALRAGGAADRQRLHRRRRASCSSRWRSRDATFRHSARELLALAAWRSGDMTGADDAGTPDDRPIPRRRRRSRSRVEMLLALGPAEGKS